MFDDEDRRRADATRAGRAVADELGFVQPLTRLQQAIVDVLLQNGSVYRAAVDQQPKAAVGDTFDPADAVRG